MKRIACIDGDVQCRSIDVSAMPFERECVPASVVVADEFRDHVLVIVGTHFVHHRRQLGEIYPWYLAHKHEPRVECSGVRPMVHVESIGCQKVEVFCACE